MGTRLTVPLATRRVPRGRRLSLTGLPVNDGIAERNHPFRPPFAAGTDQVLVAELQRHTHDRYLLRALTGGSFLDAGCSRALNHRTRWENRDRREGSGPHGGALGDSQLLKSDLRVFKVRKVGNVT